MKETSLWWMTYFLHKAAYEVEHVINDMHTMYIICHSLKTACYSCAVRRNATFQEGAKWTS